mmetsp:Transcript_33698/g.72996  ORF Transcript_33698/g.72996 Transcript_33698/m.72996 type:complete len:860 (+) Transcript_33698:82-2661(+)
MVRGSRSSKRTRAGGAGSAVVKPEPVEEEPMDIDDDGSESNTCKAIEVGFDDNESDDDEDDDEDNASGVCCDTLQDLARTVKSVVSAHYDNDGSSSSNGGSLAGTCFALPTDAPWSDLASTSSSSSPQDDPMEDGASSAPSSDATYKGEPLRVLSLVAPVCGGGPLSRATPHLLALGDSHSHEQKQQEQSGVHIHIPSLDGIVYGRLAIFGLGDEDDEEDDEDDNDQLPSNPDQDAYTKGFNLLDRCFLSEAVRDALICHRPAVTATGAERGSCRDVAEQVLAIGHLFVPPPADDGDAAAAVAATGPAAKIARGIEYGIVETILSLIVQASRREEGSDASGSPLGHLYLSRVFLEMTKLQPTLMPRSIVAAVSAIFEDFVPSLVPSARAALAGWLALHLTNTDYQWPSSYWSHWTPYALAVANANQRNSRGEFVIDTLRDMSDLQGSPSVIVSDCLPNGSALVDTLLPSTAASETTQESLQALEKDLEDRIWIHNDDPDAVREYIVGDEVQESVSGSLASSGGTSRLWWRTSVVVEAVLRPTKIDLGRARKAIQTSLSKQAGDEDIMDEEDPDLETDDVIVDTAEAIARYRPVILAAMGKDWHVYEELQGTAMDESDMLVMGEVHVLRQVERLASYSAAVLEACVDSMLKNHVVSAMAVLRWALGENDEPTPGSTGTGVGSESPIIKNWYRFALLAMRIGVSMILSGDDFDNDGGGMIIDRGGEDDATMESDESPVSRHVNKVLAFATPLINYAADRVCLILANTDESDRKRVKPVEADLIDGMKLFAVTVQSQLRSILKNDKSLIDSTKGESPAVDKEIDSCLAKSDIIGPKLSSRCRQECTAVTRYVDLTLKSIETS